MSKEQEKEYIYIMQPSNEKNTCKIGKTSDLDGRYGNVTGVSDNVKFEYLFACEVSDMSQVERDITKEFKRFREKQSREIYLFNEYFFADYVNFIKSHSLFIKEIFLEKKDEKQVEIKIIKRETPSLKERKLTQKNIMDRARRVKNDEFYTRYEDVEKEIEMYDKNIWKDKCVFCNCDDAVDENDDSKTSAFALYFIRNFKELKLKKLICTHYASKVDLFNAGSKGYAYFYIMTKEGGKGWYEKPQGYDGSFDHPESIRILKEEADIVCTNPPFSRTIDYWKLVIESGKNFIIISNITNVVTTAYIPYFMNNKVWGGYNEVDWFQNPKREKIRAAGFWYTNIPINDRPRYKQLQIVPLKKIPEKYIKYDDNKVLVVDNNYIPSGYKKPFAVSSRSILNGLLEKGYKIIQDKTYAPYINGKMKFARVLVQKVEV